MYKKVTDQTKQFRPRSPKATEKINLKSKMRSVVGPMDPVFLLLVLVLTTFGLVMVFSASYAYAQTYYGDSFHYIARQAIFAVVGVAAMLIISRIPYYVYFRLAKPIFYVCLGLIAIVFPLNGFGAGRFITLFGGQTLQPSELMKIGLIIYFAMLIQQNHQKMHTLKEGVLPFLYAIVPIMIILVALQRHLSATMIISGIGIFMMFIGGTRIRYFIPLGIAGVIGIVAMIAIQGIDYMGERIHAWLNPLEDIMGASWQTAQSLIAIGSGGLMGVGLGNSTQKHLYLPEPQNDFIFAIVCEELGFIGALLIILLFLFLICRGFYIANRAPNKFASMLTVGIMLQIAIQTTLNIAVVSNAMPNTGISLPFFSYGGTALLIQLAEMGIVLNISRYGTEEKL